MPDIQCPQSNVSTVSIYSSILLSLFFFPAVLLLEHVDYQVDSIS